MATKTRGEPGGAGSGTAEAVERLYGAPLEGFVALRRELSVALRAAGDAAGAKVVAVIAKPSRTAWALNQVARRHPAVLKATLEARATAEAAQKSADGEAMRASARAYRDRLAEVVQTATDLAREDGAELNAAQGRRISATVQAVAASDDQATREALAAGRLGADVDLDDPFAGLEMGATRERHLTAVPHADPRERAPEGRPAAASMERAHVRERELRELEKAEHRARELEKARVHKARELEKARERVAGLEAEARGLRSAARDAEVAAERAKAEAERARRAAEAVEKRLDEARAAVRAMGT
jgi:hypothetical protein